MQQPTQRHRPFLTARWSNLFLATYAVPDELLRSRLPPGLDLDRRDGQCFVSLVAFDFLDTRVKGIAWPGFRNFPEINLRFYVRCGEQRGVTFVREFVPQRMVAWLARVLYNEPYKAARMSSVVVDGPSDLTIEHRLEFGGRANVIQVCGVKPATTPTADSVEHFFKEHEWGFGTTHRGQLLRYRVEHPVWEVYRVTSWKVDLDWRAVYGPEWAVLQDATPFSTVLAVGSNIAVFPGSAIGDK
jgi:hypothetical protein